MTLRFERSFPIVESSDLERSNARAHASARPVVGARDTDARTSHGSARERALPSATFFAWTCGWTSCMYASS